MASQAKINANRKNAKKSTGPRTARGKEFIAPNAVKHGFFSRDDVVKDAKFRSISTVIAWRCWK